MKTKKIEKKLKLNKITIAALNRAELHTVLAGGTECPTTTIGVDICICESETMLFSSFCPPS